MHLAELTFEEQIVLVALLELIIGSDTRVSGEERARIERVARAIGDETYRKAAAEVDRRFHSEDDLRMFVPVIARPAARETIFETVLEAAFPGGIDAHESAVLTWLAKAWRLSPRPARSGHPS